MSKEQFKDFGICKKCLNEKPVNANSLCRNCDEKVDRELIQLYTSKLMD